MTEQFGTFSPQVGIGLARSEIIDRLYDVAVDPDRLEAFVDVWEATVGPHRRFNDAGQAVQFDDPDLEAHFDRAAILIDRLPMNSADAARDVLRRFETTAAVAVDKSLKIRISNPAAEKVFGAENGAGLEVFGLDEFEHSRMCAVVRDVQRAGGSDTQLLSYRTPDDRIMAFQIRGYRNAGGQGFALIVTSELGWSSTLNDRLKSTFKLSNAEIHVLRALVECQTPKAIAEARGRSLDTVRSQIQSILNKTETHSQPELLRITLSLMEVISGIPEIDESGTLNEGHGGLLPSPQIPVPISADRRVAHLVIGDPDGKPVLFFPVRYGLVRWPTYMERRAAELGLKIIVPIRAGYGISDPIDDDTNYVDQTIHDLVAVMDHCGAASCPIISMNSDGFLAFVLAARHPDRVTGLINCSGVLPYSSVQQYQRMDKWYRLVNANARFAPKLLPFMVKAGFFMAKRLGKAAFFQSIYAESPLDLKVIAQPDVQEALMAGSDIALSNLQNAQRAYTQEAIAYAQYNWAADVEAIKEKIPVHFMNGSEDLTVPQETLNEFRDQYDWINYHVYPNQGQLVLLTQWQDVLKLTTKLCASPG